MSKLAGILLTFFFATQFALAAEAPVVSLHRVIDILDGQAHDLRQGVANLTGLNDGQRQARQTYLMFLGGVLDYYESLRINPDGSNVKAIATEIKSRRQTNYQTEIRKISDFVLVYQAMHILDTAEKRFNRINSDLDKLIGLGLLKADKPDILLNDARASLDTASGLMSQAENLLDNRMKNDSLRFLVTDAIGKIRQAYKDFFAISSFVSQNISK